MSVPIAGGETAERVLYALPSPAVKAARLGPSYFPSTATRNWFVPEPVDGCTHV